MERTVAEIEDLYTMLRSRYSTRNDYVREMGWFFSGRQWEQYGGQDEISTTEEGDEAAEETLVVNYARVIVLKYAAVLTQGFRLTVPEPEDETGRKKAQKREAFLKSMIKEVMRAYRRAEHFACKCGYGVIQCSFAPQSELPEFRQIGEGLDKEVVVDWSFMPGQARSTYIFRSVAPQYFYPVFSGYDDPNDDLFYVLKVNRPRLVKELRARYGQELVATGGWDLLDEDQVEDTCVTIEYWDAQDYYHIAQTVRKDKPSGERTRGSRLYGAIADEVPRTQAVQLEHVKHLWGRPPFWIIPNLFIDEENPTWKGTASDIDVLEALQRRYNEMLSEVATEVRTHVHPPLIYTSDQPQQDPNKIEFGPREVIPIGAEEKLEQFKWQAQTEAAEKVVDRYRAAILDVSFLNEAAFGNATGNPSGVVVRMMQSSMEHLLALKVPTRVDALTRMFGSVLAHTEKLLELTAVQTGAYKSRAWYRHSKDAQTYAVMDLEAADIAGDYDVDIQFVQLLPADKEKAEQHEVFKYKSKAQSLRTTVMNLGVDDVDAEIERVRKELQDPVLSPEHALLIAQARSAMGTEGGAGGAGPAAGALTPGPQGEPMPAPPRSTAPTVPAGPEGAGALAPGMPREPAGVGPNLGGMPGMPPGPGINLGPESGRR